MHVKIIIVALICNLFLTNFCYSQFGELDSTFSLDGYAAYTMVDECNDVIAQPDGKILVGGYSYSAFGGKASLVRFLANGDVDTGFGLSGKTTASNGTGDGDNELNAIALQPDGKIITVGFGDYSFDNTGISVLRFLPNGFLDASFSGDGKVMTDIYADEDYAYDVAVQADGKIVVTGSAWNVDDNEFFVVRYNTDGSLDTEFGTGGIVTTAMGIRSCYANALKIQPDGKIVVCGVYEYLFEDFMVVRYNVNGSLDSTFGGDGIVTTSIQEPDLAFDLAIQEDGKIIVCGKTRLGAAWSFGLVRYNTDGTLDVSFDTDGMVITGFGSYSDFAQAVNIQGDGKIIAGGVYNYNDLNSDFAIARYLTNGSLDVTFSGDGKQISDLNVVINGNYITGMDILPDGKLIAAGGYTDFIVAKYTTGYVPCEILTNITTDGPTNFCAGSSVILNAVYDSTYTYQWFKNGTAIVGAISQTYNANTTGNYSVNIGNGICFASSDTVNVIKYPKPNPSIINIDPTNDLCFDPSIKLKTSNVMGYTYQWYNGASPIAGATSNVYMATETGNIKVRATTAFGCSKPSTPYSIINSCKLANKDFSELLIYPNPIEDLLNINLQFSSPQTGISKIKIYNMFGEVVYHDQFELKYENQIQSKLSVSYTHLTLPTSDLV